jgi:hypothetical protein
MLAKEDDVPAGVPIVDMEASLVLFLCPRFSSSMIYEWCGMDGIVKGRRRMKEEKGKEKHKS